MGDKVSPLEEMESLDPATIWRRSLLQADAFERIFAAVRLPLAIPEEERELLLLTVAKVTDWLVGFWLGRGHARQEEVDKAAAAFEAFVMALKPLARTQRVPPWPPSDWANSFIEWMKREAGRPASLGRPSKEVERTISLELLGVFHVAFDRRPASTFEGPAMRFLSAFHEEMVAVSKRAAGLDWEAPSKEAQRKLIREVMGSGERPVFALHVLRCLREARARGGDKTSGTDSYSVH